MTTYIIVSITTGILFGIMDAILNANPYAQKLLKAYQPIAKKTINAPAGITIDLIYGFTMAAIYLLISPTLPGSNLTKGITYALILWFFRVVMSTATTWMTLKIPTTTLIYTLITGLLEMLTLGIIYGIFL
jgi:hypothetical protein